MLENCDRFMFCSPYSRLSDQLWFLKSLGMKSVHRCHIREYSLQLRICFVLSLTDLPSDKCVFVTCEC